MWQVDNRTPFAAGHGWVRDRDGAEIWVVAVKATFDIKPNGITEISKEQPPVLHMPVFNGLPGRSSIKYEADLILTKKTTDILVLGHAYAPGGKQINELDVGFRVGLVKKMLSIFGDRQWQTFGISSALPFTKLPLVYERAYGGVDPKSKHPSRDWEWRNPVGTGFVASGGHAVGLKLPNIEYPDALCTSKQSSPPPAGFGPICSYWQPRVSLAGTYDDSWMKTRQPLLPEDFDERFFQCAPADQQAPTFLRGGESCVLHRLTPDGDLRFSLPKLYFGFKTCFYDGSRKIHKTRSLHTVILEPDFPRVSIVWHSALPCHFKVQKLERTIITLKNDLRNGESVDDETQREFA